MNDAGLSSSTNRRHVPDKTSRGVALALAVVLVATSFVAVDSASSPEPAAAEDPVLQPAAPPPPPPACPAGTGQAGDEPFEEAVGCVLSEPGFASPTVQPDVARVGDVLLIRTDPGGMQPCWEDIDPGGLRQRTGAELGGQPCWWEARSVSFRYVDETGGERPFAARDGEDAPGCVPPPGPLTLEHQLRACIRIEDHPPAFRHHREQWIAARSEFEYSPLPYSVPLQSVYTETLFRIDWQDGPTAVCEVLPSPTVPGLVEFDGSSSLDPVGNGLVYEWDLGDGTTQPPPAPQFTNHTYTRPGSFSASLTVTDGNFESDSVDCEPYEAEAPQLGVGLSFPDVDLPLFAPGDTVPVRISLSATEGVGDLSNVSFIGDPVDVAPDAALTLVSAPDPDDLPGPEGLTLAPGADPVTFDYEFEATQPGDFTVRSAAIGTDAAGFAAGPVEAERNGRIGALDVRVTADPDTVALEEKPDESGPEPKDVNVTVEVTNPFDTPVDDVTLRVEKPQLVTDVVPPLGYEAFTYLVSSDPPGPDDPVPGDPGDIELEDPIPAGGTITHELPGRALNAGTVDLGVVVTGSIAQDDGPPVNVTGGDTGRVEIGADVKLFFDAEVDEASVGPGPGGQDGSWVVGGQEWQIVGTMENRTPDETIEVKVLPLLTGNAHYAVPIPKYSVPPDEECGIGVLRQLGPGEEIEFAAPVRTILDGGTRGTVRYEPKGAVVEDDDTKTPLTEEQILVATGADEHTVSVDTRDRVPESSAGEIVWTYGAATLNTFADLTAGMGLMAKEAATFLLQPWKWLPAFRIASDKTAEYVYEVYQHLSPTDREDWLNNWAAALAWSTGMALVDARAAVDAHVSASFTELSTAWETGDYAAVAQWWGRQTGAAPDVALQALSEGYGVCKLLARSTPWARRAAAAKEAQLIAELEALGPAPRAADIPTGAPLVYETHGRNTYGIDRVMNNKVQPFVDEFGVPIGVRRRGPGSIAKIEAGTHGPKPFHLKAKNTSQADVGFLGFIDDLDTVAIKDPPLRGEVIAALDAIDASPDLRAQVIAQHKVRMEEWHGKGVDMFTGTGGNFATSHRAKWAEFQRKGIPMPREGAPLDYATNVAQGRSLPPDSVLYERKPFDFDTVVAPDGRAQWIAKIDRGDGFKPQTGDMDAMFVANEDLSLLSEERRIQFYERAHELGFEHVEASSWNDPAGRNGYMIAYSVNTPGSEAMYTFMPKAAPRATRFDPQHSWFDVSDTTKTVGRLYMRGANVKLVSEDPGEFTPIPDSEDDLSGYFGPKTIFLVDPKCGGGGGAGTGERVVGRVARRSGRERLPGDLRSGSGVGHPAPERRR
ncbi:MAG: PKD domain-containing protein [Acidimicrobiia bacterium]|nr:PKD domain-containing protein [Acidimicrobiia bacterium]